MALRECFCLLILCLLLGFPLARAQDDASAEALPPAATAEQLEGDYILGAGDQLLIEDVTMGNLNEDGHHFQISGDGTLDVPLLGMIALEGMTLGEAEAWLNQEYARYYRHPDISIQVSFMHPIRYYVKGAVVEPGVFTSGKNLRNQNNDLQALGAVAIQQVHYRTYLTDALLQAGGLKYNAELRDVRIRRSFPREQIIHVNLWELFRSGNTLNDLPLQDQDVVEVAELPKEQVVNEPDFRSFFKLNISTSLFPVNVIGAVKQPGSYQLKSQDGILTAIAKAGGLSEDANQKKVFILRTNASGQVFKRQVDVSDKVFKDPKRAVQAQEAMLLPDDVVFVDDSRGRKFARGAAQFLDQAAGAAMLPYFNQLIDF